MWDINNGKQKLMIKAHKGTIRAMTFGNSGHRHLYSTADDRQLICHDIEINRVSKANFIMEYHLLSMYLSAL